MEPCSRRKQQVSVLLTFALLSGVCANGLASKTVHAKVGAAVTLEAGCDTENQTLWTSGRTEPNTRIVKVSGSKLETVSTALEGRVQVDFQKGSLTITKLTDNDSGVYQWQCIGSNISSRRYILRVYSSVASPSINVKNSQHGNCRLFLVECSVENSKDLMLSWFKDRERLKDITSRDDHTSAAKLSFSVEVKHPDQSSYSCVAENPVDKQTTIFHPPDTCINVGDCSNWCQREVTVRLVFSAVVGLVLIILVVDHLRIMK